VILVDSCGWLELLTDGPLADDYVRYLTDPALLVPTIVVLEVQRVLRREGADIAEKHFASWVAAHDVVPLDLETAYLAAELGVKHRLPLADAVVYATAVLRTALVVTSDPHFAALPGVELLPHGQ